MEQPSNLGIWRGKYGEDQARFIEVVDEPNQYGLDTLVLVVTHHYLTERGETVTASKQTRYMKITTLKRKYKRVS